MDRSRARSFERRANRRSARLRSSRRRQWSWLRCGQSISFARPPTLPVPPFMPQATIGAGGKTIDASVSPRRATHRPLIRRDGAQAFPIAPAQIPGPMIEARSADARRQAIDAARAPRHAFGISDRTTQFVANPLRTIPTSAQHRAPAPSREAVDAVDRVAHAADVVVFEATAEIGPGQPRCDVPCDVGHSPSRRQYKAVNAKRAPRHTFGSPSQLSAETLPIAPLRAVPPAMPKRVVRAAHEAIETRKSQETQLTSLLSAPPRLSQPRKKIASV